MSASYLPARDLPFAVEAGRHEAATEFRATSVAYNTELDTIEIIITRNTGFVFPRAWVPALQDVPAEQLAALEVWPDGTALVIEPADIHISVHGLLMRLMPAMLPDVARPSLHAGPVARQPATAGPSIVQAAAVRDVPVQEAQEVP
jgi:hypothetical protein